MQTEALRNLVAKIKHLQCEMQTVELKGYQQGLSYTFIRYIVELCQSGRGRRYRVRHR